MSSPTWQLQEAKAKFSQVIRGASREPQLVTYRGTEAAYVVSPSWMHEYEALKNPQRATINRKQKSWRELSEPVRKLNLSDQEIEELFGRDRNPIARATDESLFD